MDAKERGQHGSILVPSHDLMGEAYCHADFMVFQSSAEKDSNLNIVHLCTRLLVFDLGQICVG